MRKHRFLTAVVPLTVMLAGIGVSMAVEQPLYKVELQAKPFEIRRYPSLVDATVQVGGSRSSAVNAGFRILANYIFGSNQTKTKIAMTAPVMQTPASGAAPGNSSEPVSPAPDRIQDWMVTFVMPSSFTLHELPAADDARIRFMQAPASRMAVITFSGLWTDANIRTHQEALLKFLAERGLKAVAGPIYAFYDPPWTPWFMRTNEVQYRLAEDAAPGSGASGAHRDPG